MSKYKVHKSSSLWLTIEADAADIAAVDSTWENFTGKYVISATKGGTPILEGELTRTSTVGKFTFALTTAACSTLSEGTTYHLISQIDNTSVDYREELHDQLEILTEGVIDP